MRGLLRRLAFGALLVPAALQAQSWVGDAQVLARPNAPTVGIALVVDGGAARDRPGREGETWLFAHTLAETLVLMAPATTARQAQVEVLEDRWALSLLVEPADALSALRDLRATLGSAPSATIAEALKARLSASFVFESGSPVREMEGERRAMLDGFDSPWARAPRGSPVSVEGLSATDLAAVGRDLGPERLRIGIVGHLDEPAVRTILGTTSSTRPDSLAAAIPPTVAATIRPGPWYGASAWTTGDRVRVVREVTNSWVTVAFPIPADLPQTLLEFLAHRMDEEISTDPPDPGIFDAEVLIVRRPAGRLLVVNVAVLPEATERWEAQILTTADLAAAPVQEAFFHWLRRRFRATVMLDESAPEALAMRLAEDLLLGIPPGRRIEEESWLLSPGLLLDASRALGPPRILVYGPNFGSGNEP